MFLQEGHFGFINFWEAIENVKQDIVSTSVARPVNNSYKKEEEEAAGEIKTDSDQSMFDSPHESRAESAEESSESDYIAQQMPAKRYWNTEGGRWKAEIS